MEKLQFRVGDVYGEYIIARIHEGPLYRDLELFHKTTGEQGIARRLKEDAPKHRLEILKRNYSEEDRYETRWILRCSTVSYLVVLIVAIIASFF